MKNNIRFDLSDRLIHFFREVDLGGQSVPVQPENFGLNNFVEGTKWPALFLLRCAVRSLRLWATWSVRGGVRTVYGPRPAVCFSEMPLAAFLETSVARKAAGQAMGLYALTFPKLGMHQMGGLPAIYGLSTPFASIPNGKDGKARILSADVLPEIEQYRYVTYSPSGPKSIDWLHEREWRWPFTGDLAKSESELEEYGVISEAADIPGLDFSNSYLRGIGIIVKTLADAKKLAYDVLTLIDQGFVGRSQFSHILVRDLLPKSVDLYQPSQVDAAIQDALLDFSSYFKFPSAEVNAQQKDFSARVASIDAGASTTELCERGGCWLWLHDNTSPYVRKLLQAGRVSVNKHGQYLAALPELDISRDLRQREELTNKLATELKSEYGLSGGYFSVLNSEDPDDLPSYIDDTLDNKLYYNTDF